MKQFNQRIPLTNPVFHQNNPPSKEKLPLKKKVKNANYRRFLDDGILDPLTIDEVKEILNNVRHPFFKMARAFVIALYYTGGRPIEVLDIKAKDVKKSGNNIIVRIRGSKGGLPRELHFPYRSYDLLKELLNYANSFFDDTFIFWKLKGTYTRRCVKKNGEVYYRTEVSDKIRHWIIKWSSTLKRGSITPYFFRHNRLSSLSQRGANMNQLRFWKGSKTFESILPYIHMSTEISKKVGRKMEK